MGQEIDELRRRVAALETRATPKRAAVPPDIERKVGMTHPQSEVFLDKRMPSDRDLASLLGIVRDGYPRLRLEGGSKACAIESKDFIAFKYSVRWLLDVRRGGLDLWHTANHWADRAQGFALFHRSKVLINANHLLCACIAAADVDFLDPHLYPNNLMHVGLKEGYGGQAANTEAWRQVLARAKAPAPSNYRPAEYSMGTRTIRCGQ